MTSRLFVGREHTGAPLSLLFCQLLTYLELAARALVTRTEPKQHGNAERDEKPQRYRERHVLRGPNSRSRTRIAEYESGHYVYHGNLSSLGPIAR